MHGRQIVSGCGTVVYTLNCENVHSSASDSGNIGFLGAVSPRKYLDLCWDFKPSQTKSSSRARRRVIPSLSSPPRVPQSDSHNPAISRHARGAWKQALKNSSAS